MADAAKSTDQDRRTQGNTDGPLEDELEKAFERQLDQGVQRLGRTWREVLATGFMGGTEVAVGVLALLAVVHATGNQLLGGLAFSLGLVALLLGRSELFTEGFLIPVVTVAARRARPRQLGRLWTGTLAANLLGGWLIMWLVVAAFPAYHEELVRAGTHFATAPLSWETFSLAILGGGVITLLTRMQSGTEEILGQIVAAVAAGFLLAGLELFHSILDSLLIFGALHTGDAGFTYLDWLWFFTYTLVGNVVGGLGLVTLLRLVRTKDKLQEERNGTTATRRSS